METKAHHALVGFFAVFLLAAGAFFVLWLSQASFNQEEKVYDVVFDGPVRGLRPASEVRFNGIQVGEVTELGLNPDNPNQVIARVRIDAATPVKVDSIAQLEPQGLTGLAYLQISGGSSGAADLETRMGDRPARIFARQAQLEGLVEGGETVIENAQITVAKLNRLLSDENIESFTNTMNSIETITNSLAENDDLVERLYTAITSLEQAALDISEAAAGVEQFSSTTEAFLINEVTPMVNETEQASISVDLASKETYDALIAIRPQLEAFANEGLGSLTSAAQDLEGLVAALERIAIQLEEDPVGMLSQSRGAEVEIPQ